MGCAIGVVKYLLFFANLAFALTGLSLITVGIIYQLNFSEFKDAIPSELRTVELAPILTIVVGSIIFCISFLGCCGAIRESTCLLTSFAVVLLCIFIFQVAIGVFAFLKVQDEDQWKSQLQSTFRDLISHYNSTSSPSNEALDLIQSEFKCCGGLGPSDYGLNTIPSSCCEKREDTSSPCILYQGGCVDKFFDFLQDSAHIVGYVVIATAIVEIVSAIFALCLSSSIKNESRRRTYA